eukprot:4961162-Pleurochrysis_carterae.AAC.1
MLRHAKVDDTEKRAKRVRRRGAQRLSAHLLSEDPLRFGPGRLSASLALAGAAPMSPTASLVTSFMASHAAASAASGDHVLRALFVSRFSR